MNPYQNYSIEGKMINHDLTPAETRAVYELAYGSGSTNKDIAKVMKVSHRTVEAHLGIAMQKLNVKNRIQLVVWAKRNLQKV